VLEARRNGLRQADGPRGEGGPIDLRLRARAVVHLGCRVWYGCPVGPTIGPRTYHLDLPTSTTPRMQGTRAEPLLDLIRHDGGRRALACPDDGSPLTYDRLAAEVLDIASRLRSAGVGRGDRVAVVLP